MLLVISIFRSPLKPGLFVEMLPQDSARDGGCPFGVARSQLTMEKTAPSLPSMCFCSQKCFYSNIHLFTTRDLRGFCFLFGALFFSFKPSLKDAFLGTLAYFMCLSRHSLVNTLWNHSVNNVFKGPCLPGRGP